MKAELGAAGFVRADQDVHALSLHDPPWSTADVLRGLRAQADAMVLMRIYAQSLSERLWRHVETSPLRAE